MYLILLDRLNQAGYLGLPLALEVLGCEVDGHGEAEPPQNLVLVLLDIID